MSYCRFSPISDIYVYLTDNDLYAIHVANSRYKSSDNYPEYNHDFVEWYNAARLWHYEHKNDEREDIHEKYAGEIYHLNKNKLLKFIPELIDLGYRIPVDIIERVESNECH